MNSALAHVLGVRLPFGRGHSGAGGSHSVQAQKRVLVAFTTCQTVFYGRFPDLAGRVRPFQRLAQEQVVANGLAQPVT